MAWGGQARIRRRMWLRRADGDAAVMVPTRVEAGGGHGTGRPRGRLVVAAAPTQGKAGGGAVAMAGEAAVPTLGEEGGDAAATRHGGRVGGRGTNARGRWRWHGVNAWGERRMGDEAGGLGLGGIGKLGLGRETGKLVLG
jgi:hypothetical protein